MYEYTVSSLGALFGPNSGPAIGESRSQGVTGDGSRVRSPASCPLTWVRALPEDEHLRHQTYSLSVGSGRHLRFRKEELVKTEKIEGGLTEEWHLAGRQIANGH